MRKPVVDYRRFRLSKLDTPEFSHLKLLLGWVVYFVLYFLTENLIPVENCHPVYSVLDDLVPFCEVFVIPYVGWYFLIVASLLYFALYNIQNFKRLQTYIIITQLVAMTVYFIYPNRQDLRPEMFPRENVFTWVIGLLYSLDTNTGVCPSLHVAYSIAIASVWQREETAGPFWKVSVIVLAVLISLSTAFIKQHSVVDIFAALPICLLAEWFVFYRKRKKTASP